MKILLICPNWTGFATPILQEMTAQGHQAIHLDHSDLSAFMYFDSSHRVVSKIYQLFSGKNYKKQVIHAQITYSLKSFFAGHPHLDLVIFTEPNRFQRSHLDFVKRHTSRMVASLWDSTSNYPNNLDQIDCFDEVYSFDQEDCRTHGFQQVHNYIDPSWSTQIPMKDAPYDVFSVMSFTKARYELLVKFLDANPTLRPNIYLYITHEKKRKYIQDHRIKVIQQLLSGKALKKEIEQSKGILDLVQGDQAGLSFRVYESIGYQRKLMTTNQHLARYDLYSRDNMEILDSDMKVRDGFLDDIYTKLPMSIMNQYMLSTWVQTVTRHSAKII